MAKQSLITIVEARERVLAHAEPLDGERVDVEQALGRVLATPIAASGDMPPFDCAAMDGYAIEAGPAGRTLTLVGEARAGTPSGRTLGGGEAIRISTGAAFPAGAGAVVRQEDVEAREGVIEAKVEVREGQHVRRAGEDLRAGAMVLEAGTRLGTAELGTAVAAGVGRADRRAAAACRGDLYRRRAARARGAARAGSDPQLERDHADVARHPRGGACDAGRAAAR